MNNSYKIIISCLVFFVLCLLLTNRCSDEISKNVIEKSNNDSLFDVIKRDSLRIVELESKLSLSSIKQDSLKVLKDKAETKLKASSKLVRVQISEGICDTNTVKMALNDCDSMNVVNNKVINEKDSAISILIEISTKQKEDLATAKNIIRNKSNDYDRLEEEYNKVVSKNKKTKVKIIALAVLAQLVTIFALR